jgi:uncharacterized membrane protein
MTLSLDNININLLTAENIPIIVIIVLLFFIFIFWVRSLVNSPYAKRKKEVDNALLFLKNAKIYEQLDLSNKNADSFNKIIRPHLLGEGNEKYFIPKLHPSGKILTHVPIEEIIQLPRDDHSNIPSILTSIGVIGTFAGITLALQDLDSFQAGNDLDAMMKGAMTLIEGMKTAFYTSLVGLILAALSMGILSKRRGDRNKEEHAIFTKISEILVEASPIEVLYQLASPEKIEADKAAMHAAQSMQEAAQAMSESLSGFNADVIAERVGEAITTTLEDKMLPTFNHMNKSLESIQQRMENQNQDVLETMIADLRDKVIAPMADVVIDSTHANKELSEAVNKLQNDLIQVTSSLESTVGHINKSAEHLVEQSQKLLESKNDVMELVEMVGMNKAASFNKLEQVAKHLHGTVSELDQNYNAVQASLNSLKDTISSYIEEAEKHQRKFFTEYDIHSKTLFNAIHTSAETIAASIEAAKNPNLGSEQS